MTIEDEIGEGKCYTVYKREFIVGNKSGAEAPYLLEETYRTYIKNIRRPQVPREHCGNLLGQGKRCPQFEECYQT